MTESRSPMTLIERIRAWLTAEPADELPAYPCISAPDVPASPLERLEAEFARLRDYRDTYGISFEQALAVWRRGVSVDDVIARIKAKLERVQ